MSNEGKRFLEELISRAETVLGKMVYKLHHEEIALENVVAMINSVYGFVNLWEQPLENVKPNGLSLPRETRPNEQQLLEEVNRVPKDDQRCQREARVADGSKHGAAKTATNEPQFEFTGPSLQDYSPGQTGVCMITHVIPGSDTFFMLDRSKGGKTEEALLTLQNVTATLGGLPQSTGIVFGVELDGAIFRAVRSVAHCRPVSLRLLDTGEVLPYQATMTLYELPAYYQSFRPFAIPCRLVGVMGASERTNLQRYLKKNLLSDQKYSIHDRTGSSLSVSLSGVAQKQPNVVVKPLPKEPNQPIPKYKISEETLTAEQRDILYEELPSTSNAMKATMGYVPKDDRRICPHYDPKLQGCFKGNRCRLEHVAKDADGWTRDQALHKVKIRAQLAEPQLGTSLQMLPTVVTAVDEFYAQLYHVDNVNGLSNLQSRLNAPAVQKELRKMDHTPYFREFVFAEYESEWCRAEVVEYFNDAVITVFYLDYGNQANVPIDRLRLWDDRFDNLPFQAVKCRLGNVRRMHDADNRMAVDVLSDIIVDKCVLVKVLDIRSYWEVLVFNSAGEDVGQLLVKMEVAAPREPIAIVDRNGLIPA